ncbi:hypothetical protein K435DRAFT_806255 [Dendrothele bispora CBS 962.96]|uniref:Uncharacterized protein n=1 Tax=Dendrothele bispora (strain CBS 962.96) TaxID=1314807 RepID=A0A4S8L8E6_DENBC|nr:hypothetical protein K435DRAFT_806255 [Dendrothele bispora CBS 962.96]
MAMTLAKITPMGLHLSLRKVYIGDGFKNGGMGDDFGVLVKVGRGAGSWQYESLEKYKIIAEPLGLAPYKNSRDFSHAVNKEARTPPATSLHHSFNNWNPNLNPPILIPLIPVSLSRLAETRAVGTEQHIASMRTVQFIVLHQKVQNHDGICDHHYSLSFHLKIRARHRYRICTVYGYRDTVPYPYRVKIFGTSIRHVKNQVLSIFVTSSYYTNKFGNTFSR